VQKKEKILAWYSCILAERSMGDGGDVVQEKINDLYRLWGRPSHHKSMASAKQRKRNRATRVRSRGNEANQPWGGSRETASALNLEKKKLSIHIPEKEKERKARAREEGKDGDRISVRPERERTVNVRVVPKEKPEPIKAIKTSLKIFSRKERCTTTERVVFPRSQLPSPWGKRAW